MDTYIRDNQLYLKAALEDHSYSYHTDITREISICAAAGSSGTMAEADDYVYGSRVWTDAALEFTQFFLKVPDDYVSTPQLHIVWASGVVAAGNLYWKAQIQFAAADEAVNTQSSDPGYGTDATAGANTINVDAPPVALDWTGLITGDYLGIRITRDGTHVNDTLNADAWLLGIVFSYTARQ